jgi:hypothetical protein
LILRNHQDPRLGGYAGIIAITGLVIIFIRLNKAYPTNGGLR